MCCAVCRLARIKFRSTIDAINCHQQSIQPCAQAATAGNLRKYCTAAEGTPRLTPHSPRPIVHLLVVQLLRLPLGANTVRLWRGDQRTVGAISPPSAVASPAIMCVVVAPCSPLTPSVMIGFPPIKYGICKNDQHAAVESLATTAEACVSVCSMKTVSDVADHLDLRSKCRECCICINENTYTGNTCTPSDSCSLEWPLKSFRSSTGGTIG